VLLRWLEETAPDLVCLQELKSPDETFPLAAIKAGDYNLKPTVFSERLRARRGPAHRPPAAEPVDRRPAGGRPVDRFVRGWDKTSDHAPTWVEISD
jgi:exonuclease III